MVGLLEGILIAISSIAFLLGTPLNILGVCYFLQDTSKNKLFVVLSLVDIILCLCMIQNLVALSAGLDTTQAVQMMSCRVISYIWNVSSRFSLFLSSIVSVARVISLKYPFRFSIPFRPVFGIMVLQFLYLVLFECSANFASDKIIIFEFGSCNWTVKKEVARVYTLLYFVSYILPFVITVTSTLLAIAILRQNKTQFSELEEENRVAYATKCYASQTMLILVVIYCVCNVPYAVFLILAQIDKHTNAEIRKMLFGNKSNIIVVNCIGAAYPIAVNATVTPLVFLLRLSLESF